VLTGIESARRKILRAMEHQETIENAIAEYRGRHPYEKIIQPNSAPKLKITEQPPVDISILLGEILYQLRSTLDHLFFDLIRRTFIGPFTKKDARRQFPLLLERPRGYESVSPVPLAALDLPYWIPVDAYTLIEGLQPYNRLQGFHDLMRMLAVFSNIDKHRYLQTTVAVVNRRHTIITTEGLTSSVTTIMLQDGAELDEPVHHFAAIDKHQAVEVQDEYIVDIAFDEPEFGPPQTALIEQVVYGLPTLIFSVSTHFQQFLG
jgi:hypothetical protein